MKNAGKACNNRLYRHIRTFEKIIKNYFVIFIKIENYCEDKIQKNENDLITTTKVDRQNHGFGLKSIRTAVEKYNGSVDFGVDQNWFELKILLPRVM